jgi:hypothetical protein
MNDSPELLRELLLWRDAEKVTTELLKDDPDLLRRTQTTLADMRLAILKDSNEQLFKDYKELYNALCEVLTIRIQKC